MQITTYNIIDKMPVYLWRAIPAQITVTGIEDTSGTWVFLLDNDWIDGALVVGIVTVENGNLIVTLDDLDNAYLANAINGKEKIQCKGTLTNAVNQCYIMTVIVQNRTTLQAPPEPLPPTRVFVKTVNGESGVVVLDATDVGALGNLGKDVVSLESSTFTPEYSKVYSLTLTSDTAITFNTELQNKIIDFELHIAQGNTAYNVTWPNGLKWGDDEGKFSSSNNDPDIITANTLYAFTVRNVFGLKTLINLAYTQEL